MPPCHPRLPPRTHIQNHRNASAGLRGEELLLSHRCLLPAGGVLAAGDVLVVAHLGDDPADEPVESNGLGAAVSGLRCRRALAVFTGFGFGLFAAVVGSKFGLFFVEQFVDPVPTIARCLLTHPFDGGRSCCAVEAGGEAPTAHFPLHHRTCPRNAPVTPAHPTEEQGRNQTRTRCVALRDSFNSIIVAFISFQWMQHSDRTNVDFLFSFYFSAFH